MTPARHRDGDPAARQGHRSRREVPGMNSGTLVGSLIFAAVLVVVITVVIQLMMRAWHRRSQQQAELIGVPARDPGRGGCGDHHHRGHYCGSMMAPGWNERIAAGDLGYRSKAVLTRYAGESWWNAFGPNRFGFHRTRSRLSAWSAEWQAGSRLGLAYWRSGGGCRRASRSTPAFGRTTATNTPEWLESQQEERRVSKAFWYSKTAASSPARRSARSAKRWARPCFPPACPATRRR